MNVKCITPPEGVSKAVIFGAGVWGEKCLNRLRKQFDFRGFIDNAEDKIGTVYCGLPVVSLDSFLADPAFLECVIVVAFRYPHSIVLQLREREVPRCRQRLFRLHPDNENYSLYDLAFLDPKTLYDDAYHIWSNQYLKGYKETSDYKRFCVMMDLMRTEISPENKILELGSGTGQFANMLFDNGYKNYLGVDVSEYGVEHAKTICAGQLANRFVCCDFFDFDFQIDYDCVVVMEVLEHIEEDIALLRKLRSGTKLYFTVPNFMSFSHVRCFESLWDIQERYDALMEIVSFECVKNYDCYCTYVVSSVIR